MAYYDPDDDLLFMKWELRTEAYYRGITGGEAERGGELILASDSILPYTPEFSFKTPHEYGEYRLYVYAYDDLDYVATANIPLYVMS